MSFILNIYRGLRPGNGSLRNRLKYIVCSDPSVFSWWHTHGTAYSMNILSGLLVAGGAQNVSGPLILSCSFGGGLSINSRDVICNIFSE